MDWHIEVEHEMNQARQARRRGNEGRARVCARRAAGILAREYFARRGPVERAGSAVDLLQRLQNDPGLPPDVLQLVEHLTQRVDARFHLPPGVDLLDDVGALRRLLLRA